MSISRELVISEPQEYTGENLSGISPVEYKVLVLPDLPPKKTAGGIIVPDNAHTERQARETKATVIAVGGSAFEDWEKLDIPTPGNRVTLNKYAGVLTMGKDGKEYRIINDKEINAIINF